MAYSEEGLVKIEEKYEELGATYNNLNNELMNFCQRLEKENAKEYLMQGVGRRLKILYRCIKNIFTIHPASRTNPLPQEKLTDLNINLHAFFINIAGVFDNLGWVFVHENELLGKTQDGKIPRNGVGLFCAATQDHLKPELRNYLTSGPIQAWYNDYSKIYRDSLAHRIPLYVPPALLNHEETKKYQEIERQIQELGISKESDGDTHDGLSDIQQKLGKASHIFAHSLRVQSKPVFFHAQVLADFATVKEVIEKFCENF